MKPHRYFRLSLGIALGVLLAPVLLWVLIVMVAPTNWARSHISAAMAQAIGRSVQLDDLAVCMGGGIELSGLRIGAPGSVSDPWLQTERIQIDVSLLQLLRGRFEPTYLEVEGATLRVLRREDGSLELADLVQTSGERAPETGSEPDRGGPARLKARLRRTKVYIVDRPTKTEMTLEDVEGEGLWEGDGNVAVTLSGQWNKGPFQFTAHLDRTGAEPSFEGEFRGSDVVLDQGMNALRYAVPVLAGARGTLQGRLTTDVYLRGRGMTRDQLCKTLVGHGKLALDPIELAGTPLLDEVVKALALTGGERVGSVRTEFAVQDGRITTDKLVLKAGRAPVLISGWTSLDGRLDYHAKLEGLVERVPEKARRFISGLDLDLDSMTTLRLTGTIDRVAIKTNLTGPDGRSSVDRLISPEDRDRLRMLGRQFRDRVVR